MAGHSREALEQLRGVVRHAEANGSLSRDMAENFWNIAGRSHEALTGETTDATPAPRYAAPVDPGRDLTITLQVRGRVATGVQTQNAVEQALVNLGRQQGVEVVAGSVRVRG